MHPPDRSRPSLDLSRLTAGTLPWARVEVVDEAPSTNALLAERARAGAVEGVVVVAEHQTAGRGRLDRTWTTPPRAALTFSVLLRPKVPDLAWSWLPLLTGVAVVEGIAAAGGPRCGLKWPNDVMYGGRKLAGLLAERVSTPDGAAAVLGIGLNVSTRSEELPVETATSLQLAGMQRPDRTSLLVAVLEALGTRYLTWAAAGGDPGPLLADYRARCTTVGQDVVVSLPSGAALTGRAAGIDATGALVVDSPEGRVTISAGDVVHVRPQG